MSDSDPTATSSDDANPQPASGSANQSRVTTLREEIRSIDDKLNLPTMDLQTKMELKGRRSMLERQVNDIEKKNK
ncbi:hypothetical protein [Phycisphaera mikurensis]|uniref:Uncharacterized protein n=1 Tax=Phycisphaera mikurensis (strain NBRC 102666 / KCTC 22515 / FYK2301M01) TaxID=1142394 RepID=I0IIQ6_PHYMF|nr:hypothetical protein [Phycisphaera mikurensis]MBB6442704.1 polyhydroxyalkanoate synthesis regulator phasin [Phycisphaera mikurensis]BAM05144.1 hypothetical protein PSMK_29850 [Phycisphaera mikurensis NBRC 102666]